MKPINFVLFLIAGLLAYRLVFGHNGINFYNSNRHDVSQLKQDNEALQKRNELLSADVNDLKVGWEGIEERARNELGMIKENETFFRLVPAQPQEQE